MSLLDLVVAQKMKLGCEDRYASLEDICLSIDQSSPFDFAKMFRVLVDESAEDFMIEFMSAYNNEVRPTY